MTIIPEAINEMSAVVAGRCPQCGHWAGVIVKRFDSPLDALAEDSWPDITCHPVICCGQEVWPTHFLVIYQGKVVEEVQIGGPRLPVTRQRLH